MSALRTFHFKKRTRTYTLTIDFGWLVGWLVGCVGLNGPLRQYFSLYRAVSPRQGERKREMIDERKHVQTTPPAPTASAAGPCLTKIQISRTPRHWKFTQHHRITRLLLSQSMCVRACTCICLHIILKLLLYYLHLHSKMLALEITAFLVAK